MLCYKCNNTIPDNSLVCPMCGAEMSDMAKERQSFGTGENKPLYLSMKWYRFLIYFMLFADAIMSISTAASYFSGKIYELGTDGQILFTSISEYGTAFRILLIAYAVYLLAFAFLAILTRQRLAKFKKNGPLMLYISYIFNAVFTFAFVVGTCIITGTLSLGLPSAIWSFISQMVYVYLNYVYFKKRKHFFAN